MLRKKFKDEKLLNLLDEIIDSHQGLPLGSLLSQFFGNYYLTWFDHWVKEELKIKEYYRYCDDVVILSGNKEKLHKWLSEIKKYLWENLRLEVKGNYQIFPVDSRGIDFLGFVHRSTHTRLRKSIKKRYIKTTNPKSLASYNGWIKYCDGKNLKNTYEPKN